MKIDFKLTKEDYIEFNTYHMEHSKVVKKSMFLQRYVVSLVYLIAPFVFSRISDIPFLYWMIPFAIIYILWIVLYPKRIRRLTGKRIKKMLEEGDNSEFLGDQSIILTEEGIEKKSPTSERKNGWASVQRIEETKRLLMIYVSAVSAYLVPLNAFGSEEEKNLFINQIKSKMEIK